ncbi:hypothetical protein [Moorena sp. SIO3A2]|uniref:hypothetical protein n=1 Tax=Moorena sp. SIO3A2 TaxID=2607841 RepID=UPI00257EE188|nr:hypothetical protein [Moorena sp. SIO3A2]
MPICLKLRLKIIANLKVSSELSAISYQLSAISYQLSAISYQLSAISYQLSAISYQLSAISYQLLAYGSQASSLCHGTVRAAPQVAQSVLLNKIS